MPERKRPIRWRFWRRRQAAGFTCAEMVELVTLYLEDAMGAEDRARFEAHLGACPHCSAYLEQMRVTLEAAGRIDADGISPEAESELLAAFREWKRP